MKQFNSIALLATIAMLGNGCVSRTVTQEKGYGGDTTETKIIWIWQKEYRKSK